MMSRQTQVRSLTLSPDGLLRSSHELLLGSPLNSSRPRANRQHELNLTGFPPKVASAPAQWIRRWWRTNGHLPVKSSPITAIVAWTKSNRIVCEQFAKRWAEQPPSRLGTLLSVELHLTPRQQAEVAMLGTLRWFFSIERKMRAHMLLLEQLAEQPNDTPVALLDCDTTFFHSESLEVLFRMCMQDVCFMQEGGGAVNSGLMIIPNASSHPLRRLLQNVTQLLTNAVDSSVHIGITAAHAQSVAHNETRGSHSSPRKIKPGQSVESTDDRSILRLLHSHLVGRVHFGDQTIYNQMLPNASRNGLRWAFLPREAVAYGCTAISSVDRSQVHAHLPPRYELPRGTPCLPQLTHRTRWPTRAGTCRPCSASPDQPS